MENGKPPANDPSGSEGETLVDDYALRDAVKLLSDVSIQLQKLAASTGHDWTAGAITAMAAMTIGTARQFAIASGARPSMTVKPGGN